MSGNFNVIHYSLNAGEVSPRMAARQDQNKYLACCLTMLNARPLVVGGATWREGTQFVARAKTVSGHQEKIIRPFVAGRSAAYVMEFGHQYVRIYRNGAPLFAGSSTGGLDTVTKRLSLLGSGLPWEELLPIPDGVLSTEDRLLILGAFSFNVVGELVTPYTDTDLAELFLVQSIDVCYLLHRNYPVHKITRITETEFVLTEVNFNPPATLEEEPTGENLGMGTLTPSATTGSGVTFDSQSGGFLAADVGRIIVAGGSRGVIASVVDTDTVTVDIIDAFPDTSPIAATNWRMTLSPQTTLDISNDRQEVGQVVTLTAGAAAFRAADQGKWITMFGGLLRIDSVNSTTSLTATIKSRLEDIETSNPDATRAWTLEVAAWSATRGYPSCGCFFQGRFWLFKGVTVNGSVSNDFENFAKGGNDDAAIARTLSDDDLDSIVWGKGDKTLKIGTASGIYECSPSSSSKQALTPDSFKIDPIDPNGSARIPPLRVSPVLIYLDASKRELRELSYSFAEDNFKSPHLFRLAEHFMNGFFVTEMAYASAPDSIVYVIRNDGVLLGQVYEQVENEKGWFRIETDGEFKSVCVIPRPDTGKDWIWAIVERENGIFVEYFEPDHPNAGREWNDLQTDCAIVTTHNVNFVVSGLDIHEGRTVWVIGDGMLFNTSRDAQGRMISTAVVQAGQITLNPQIPVSKVEIGLAYEGRIVPVEPRIIDQAGTPLIAKGYVKAGIVVDRALGMRVKAYRVNRREPGDSDIVGEELAWRKPYHLLDRQVPLQRGQKCVLNLGYDFARVEILRDKPFPAEILSVIGQLHVGDMWNCETDDVNEVFF